MRITSPFLLLLGAVAFVGCDSVAPSSTADAGGSTVTCNPPTILDIVPNGSNAVDVSYSLGSTNADNASLQGNVEIREVGTSSWTPVEGTGSNGVLTVHHLVEPASGGTLYDVRAFQTCSNDATPGGGLSVPDGATSGSSNLFRDRLVHTIFPY